MQRRGLPAVAGLQRGILVLHLSFVTSTVQVYVRYIHSMSPPI